MVMLNTILLSCATLALGYLLLVVFRQRAIARVMKEKHRRELKRANDEITRQAKRARESYQQMLNDRELGRGAKCHMFGIVAVRRLSQMKADWEGMCGTGISVLDFRNCFDLDQQRKDNPNGLDPLECIPGLGFVARASTAGVVQVLNAESRRHQWREPTPSELLKVERWLGQSVPTIV